MKKLFMLGIATIIIFLSVLGITDQALADEEKIKVVFEMTTPEVFKEEVRVITRNLETNKKYAFSIASGAEYSSFLRVPPGEYSLEVEFKEGSLYTSNAQETYSFQSEGQIITFDIFLREETSTPSSEPDAIVESSEEKKVTTENGEAYVEVKHPIYVYNEFLERFSYTEGDKFINSRNGFFYKNDSAKRIFLEDNPEHTEDMYEDMTGYESYLWKMTIYWPKAELKDAPKSLENYLDADILALMKKNFVENDKSGYVGMEDAYYALEDVWKWYYDYYQKTGEIFDFEEQEWFSIETIAFMQEPSLWTDSDTMLVKLFGTDLTLETLEEIEKGPGASSEEVKENSSTATVEEEHAVTEESDDSKEEKQTIFSLICNWFAENIFTTILIIVLCVVCVILFFRNKKKNA